MPDSGPDLCQALCCPHCGADIRAHDAFCLTCGGALQRPQQEPSATAVPADDGLAEPTKRRPPAVRRILLPLGLFVLGGVLGYLLSGAPDTAEPATASAAPMATADTGLTPSPADGVAESDQGPGPDQSLIPLPAKPETDLLHPSAQSDIAYFESAIPDQSPRQRLQCLSLSSALRPDLYSVGLRSGRGLSDFLAVVVIEYANGRTVATSVEPVYFRQDVAAAELCTFTMDISALEYVVRTGPGGAVPFGNDGVNRRRLIDGGRISICYFEGDTLLTTQLLTDNSETP